VSEPPDKPGSAAPHPPGETPRATTTQPLAPVDPSEVEAAGFETTGTFRTTPLPGVPLLDAPFPPAPPPPAPARAPAGPGGPRPAAGPAPPVPPKATAASRPPAPPGGAAGTRPTPPAVPRSPTREQPAAGQPPRAPLGSPTGEFLTEQARAAGPTPQPGVVPTRVFRPTGNQPASPPLPSLGVSIAPVIPPLAPVKAAPRPATQPPRIPHRPTRDPMSETSLGIPVMPPIPPVEAGPLPPLDVRIAPLVPPVAPVGTASPPGADPEAQVAWKAERLDTLDYFQLLEVPTTASAGEVKRAFYRESRAYHPDRFFHLADEGFKARVHEVYKRVTEAYYVLRDDVRRPKYLADVSGPDRRRKLRFDELSEQETKAQVKQQAAEQIGLNPKARQLFQTALGDVERGNLAAAERGLKMALTYEPQNALYREKLTEVQARLHEESRGKAFKIT
jgi:DnaJ domain